MRTVAALALLPLLAACAGDGDEPAAIRTSAPPSASASASPDASPSPAESPSAVTPTGTAARAVYYLRDTHTGPRLYREFHRRAATTGVVRDAVTAMLTEPPADKDYTSLWAPGTQVRGARIEGSTAVVDLSKEASTGRGGAAFEAASLQQLVYTVTAAAPSVTSVQLLVEGNRVESLWGHVDTSKPMTRNPPEETLGPVWILQPESGRLARGGTFGGEATVFEATVSWELLQGGTVVKRGFSTATEGAPGRGTWTGRADVPPGSYVLRAFESSAEDGRPLFVDDKPLTVT